MVLTKYSEPKHPDIANTTKVIMYITFILVTVRLDILESKCLLHDCNSASVKLCSILLTTVNCSVETIHYELW